MAITGADNELSANDGTGEWEEEQGMETIKGWVRRQITNLRSLSKQKNTWDEVSQAAPLRDFTKERETTRAGQMSAEDQQWEAETQARDRKGQDKTDYSA
jgi:hypothetical protein